MVKVNVYLADQVVASIRYQAKVRGISFSEMLRRIVEKGYLESVKEWTDVTFRHEEPERRP